MFERFHPSSRFVFVFEYISLELRQSKRAQRSERSGASAAERAQRYNIRRPFLPTVHSYGGGAACFFTLLFHHLREISTVSWYLNISLSNFVKASERSEHSEHSERSERYNFRRPFLPTVHSYGGGAACFFTLLFHHLREIS
jgi:hypothetical protein